ncbi:hypothetical protein [Aquibacillus saliphilus]|uniref:hypothetical protein n=1 Tax=Aquibacillus saliphilus TaxID=1909422 RepID=UPI001CEFEB01|nr:hypothetical protein [Aquibacillus saliphilus]
MSLIDNLKAKNYTDKAIEKIKQKLEIDNYQHLKKYTVEVRNKTSVNYTNKQTQINTKFPIGLVKNEKCLVVRDSSGNIIPHQWEDDRDVKLSYDSNRGRYSDGSLKAGYIWIESSILAGASAVFEVVVYPDEVSEHSQVVTGSVDETDVTLDNGTILMSFPESKFYELQEINNNGNIEKMLNRIQIGYSGVNYLVAATNYRNVSTEINGSGVIYKEFKGVNMFFKDGIDLWQVTYRTRLFKNGIIKQRVDFKNMKDLLASEVTNAMNRFAFTGTHTLAGGVTQTSWTQNTTKRTAVIVSAVGDEPRGGNDIPTIYAHAQIVANSPLSGDFEMLAGFKSNNNTADITSGRTYTSQYEINMVGVDTAQNELTRSLNTLIGSITDKMPITLKNDILQKTGQVTKHLLDYYYDRYGNTPVNGLHPPTAAKLGLHKLYGDYTLDELSAEYKNTLSTLYGEITIASLWDQRKVDAFSLDIAGRLFPLAYEFYKEYTKLNNQTEVNFYEGIIEAYTEMLCSSYEQQGFIGLVYTTGNNSNANAMGLHGIALGLKVKDIAYANYTRWLNIYDANLVIFQEFIRGENILVDLKTQGLSVANYYHYALFAMYEYSRACDLMGSEPILDLTSYGMTGASAYGGLKEEQYCVSSARRGTHLTYSYLAYLLTKSGGVSEKEQSNAVLEHLINQNKPLAGTEFPLDNFWNPTSTENGSICITTQSFGSLIDYLINK